MLSKRFIEIQKEERLVTTDKIMQLDASDGVKNDIMYLFMDLQQAINNYAVRVDRFIDENVVPATLQAMSVERERVTQRLIAENTGDSQSHED